KGSYGVVYKSRHIELNSVFALKCISVLHESESITTEKNVNSQLKHENIIRYYANFFRDDYVY
ncbi:MAG: hypothetical protein MHPSP_004006, partial [Paramarteilia canceri]